jgi:hypothetical protein
MGGIGGHVHGVPAAAAAAMQVHRQAHGANLQPRFKELLLHFTQMVM